MTSIPETIGLLQERKDHIDSQKLDGKLGEQAKRLSEILGRKIQLLLSKQDANER